MALNGRPERVLSNSEPSTVKRRTIVARSCGRVLSVARSHRLIRLADAAAQAPHVVVQSGEPCANQSNIASGRERAKATDVSRIVAVAHNNECWNGQHSKTINQPLVRTDVRPLWVSCGESWYFVKTSSSQTNTHTASARRRNTCWTFRGGLHRRLARPCSLNCVQTQTKH